MAEILSPGYVEVPQRSKAGDCTFGNMKTPEKKPLSPVDFKPSSPDQLCNRCWTEEMLQLKKAQEEALKQKEREEFQRHLEDLKREEENQRKRREAIQNELKKAASEALTESAKKKTKRSEQTEPVEPPVTEHAVKPKMGNVPYKYREELRNEIEARRKAAMEEKQKEKEQERALTGLNFESLKGDKYKEYRGHHKEILKRQIMEEQYRKTQDYGMEDKSPSKLDEDLIARQNAFSEEKQKKKAAVKADYQAYMQAKEMQEMAKRQQKAKEQEEILEKDRTLKEQFQAEKRAEQEKKRNLGSFLESQIQEKSPKKSVAKYSNADIEVTEKAVRPITQPEGTPPKPKLNPIETKKDNLRMVQQKELSKAYEKDKEKELDQEYLKREQMLDKARREAEFLKKEEQRRNYEEACKNLEAKKFHKLEARTGDKDDLEYYERLNTELMNKIKEEKTKQKEVTKGYNASLLEQMHANEEAKKKQREYELEKERALQGIDLDSYKRNEVSAKIKEKYKQEISHQYTEALSKKPNTEVGQTGKLSLVDADTEEQRLIKEKEDAKKKKAEQREAYLKALEERASQKKISEEQKIVEITKRKEEEIQTKQYLEQFKKNEKERQKQLAEQLEAQTEMEKAKKGKEKSERFEWMDDRARKHAEAVEERVNKLREEIQKCIKCNNNFKKSPVKVKSPQKSHQLI
eukprot:TRINITY_DN71042_c2_g1_i1.p1 TRINITY_DN71042_c2_g1~~TRINITY_DN71042_c2_g1_i1.p1  ORF type:complete len:691 (-),score=184.61 TRINITY_DN71042_c2_g1_i1:95-2167(-)